MMVRFSAFCASCSIAAAARSLLASPPERTISTSGGSPPCARIATRFHPARSPLDASVLSLAAASVRMPCVGAVSALTNCRIIASSSMLVIMLLPPPPPEKAAVPCLCAPPEVG